MYCSAQQEATAIGLTKDILSLFWPISFCGSKVQQELKK